MIILNFILALLLTIIIEIIVAYLFKIKTKNQILIIILINVITNPALNWFVYLLNQFDIIKKNIFLILFSEAIVVLIEGKLIKKYVVDKNAYYISFAMNLCSFLIGLLIFPNWIII